MTVIAYDGKILASDRRAVSGTCHVSVKKIRKINEYLCGIAGNASNAEVLFKWIECGMKKEEYPSFQSDPDKSVHLILIKDGKIFAVENESHIPFQIEERFYAIGSGKSFALAAMHLGKNAVDAVKLACHFDIYCGNGVDFLMEDERIDNDNDKQSIGC